MLVKFAVSVVLGKKNKSFFIGCVFHILIYLSISVYFVSSPDKPEHLETSVSVSDARLASDTLPCHAFSLPSST